MLRTARSVAPILRALILGSAAACMAVGTGAGIVGCADENEPGTWVKRLDDPVTRPAAIKRLIQFFEDAMTRANKDRNDPVVKGLLDKVVEPLAKTYTDGNLDDRTRIELIKFLSDTRDPRAKVAWIKACSSFATGGGASEDDVRWAAPAIGALKLDEGADALGQAFVKIQAGTQKGSQAYKNVHDAMLSMKSPAWKPLLLERINRPIDKPGSVAGDNAKVGPYQNELFWQTTAAELLGELRDPAAVKPLLKVVLAPSKADVAGSASVALIKIGKDAVPTLVTAMSGQDAEIVDYAKTQSGGNAEEAKSYVRTSAIVLGAIGRPDAVGPMVRALGTADSDMNRAVLARELTKFANTPESEKAFQAAFEKINPTALIPPGNNARAQLMEFSAHFYDPQLVPWLLKQIKEAKGGDNEKDVVQIAGLVSAMKLMTKAQVGEVKASVDKEGTPIEKDAFKLASDVVNACGENVGCYLSKIQEPAAQEEKTQFMGLKAASMLAILGNAGTSMEVVKQLPKVRNAAVRYAAALAIDHLTQKDATPVADALQQIVDENKTKDDRNMMQADQPVKEIMYRLRAR